MQEHHLVAYIEDEGSRDAISLALKELSFTNFQVFSGSAKTAATNLIRLGNPKLLIVDVSSSTLPLSDISELAEVCEAGTKVIVIGSRNDVSLFRQLIQMGICDYLVKPVNTGLVKKSLLSIFENRGVPKATTRLSKQVAVIGVKGGVGGVDDSQFAGPSHERQHQEKSAALGPESMPWRLGPTQRCSAFEGVGHVSGNQQSNRLGAL